MELGDFLLFFHVELILFFDELQHVHSELRTLLSLVYFVELVDRYVLFIRGRRLLLRSLLFRTHK